MDKPKKLFPTDYSPYFAPVAAVEKFMQAAGHLPTFMQSDAESRRFDLDTMRLYYKFIQEEYKELTDAWALYDAALERENADAADLAYAAIYEILDGGHDLIWVTIGMLLATGFPIQACWAEVANSNLAKIDRATDSVTRREDGKILKPEGWKPPDFAAIIGAHFRKKL